MRIILKISLVLSDKMSNRLSVKGKPIFLNDLKMPIDNHFFLMYNKKTKSYADMAELADASDLGSDGTPVQVQILLSAPKILVASQRGFFIQAVRLGM